MPKKIDTAGLKHFKDKENAMVASEFSASKSYAIGEYVYYKGTLYKFKAAHAAGAWTNADVDAVKLADDVSVLKESLTAVVDSGSLMTLSRQEVHDNYIYERGNIVNVVDNVNLGTTKGASLVRNQSVGAYIYKLPISNGIKQVSFPVFKTSVTFGNYATDENDTVVWVRAEKLNDTGTQVTDELPTTAKFLYLCVTQSINNANPNWYFSEVLYGLKDCLNNFLPPEKIITKDNKNGYIYRFAKIIAMGHIGESISNALVNSGYGSYIIKVPVKWYKSLIYPLYLSQNAMYGTAICDKNDIIIWEYSNSTESTGTPYNVAIPNNAEYAYIGFTAASDETNWEVKISIKEMPSLLDDAITPFADANKNLCLAGIKTDILTNKIPYHRGFLFHKLQNNDNSLWYGTDFNKINKIGTVAFNPTLMRFAISPKDGRVIAVQRDTRNGIWVWDGETETHLNSFTTNPMAWLYNSGVDFINDGTDEYCVFAEYNGSPTTGMVFNVWRGKYPYTSASDWEIVKTESYPDIMHFHQVKRDPWTNTLYLTCGDSSTQSKWWYSTDYGTTWTLLVSGSDTGWGNSLCRTINFIFTKDYIYWATDHGQSEHTLNRIQRDSQTGIINLATKEKLTDLPALYATNSLCYVESPNGLFMYDRIDTESSSIFGGDITMKFWSFDTEQLEDIATLGLTENTWGGSRGKCYINYTNSKQTMPAMGFSIDTPCIFDLVCDNPANIGTIAYDVGSKTIHTVDY